MNTSFAYIASTLLGMLTLGAAFSAVTLRNPVHCGLSLALAFMGVAGIFIFLGAEFVGFIQILVYVGAVAVLIMFVILLTRPEAGDPETPRFRPLRKLLPGLILAALPAIVVAELTGRWQGLAGGGQASMLAIGVIIILALTLGRRLPPGSFARLGVALAVFAVLAVVIFGSPSLRQGVSPGSFGLTVADIGEKLVTTHLLPLQITGILLTAALIGAVVFGMKDES